MFKTPICVLGMAQGKLNMKARAMFKDRKTVIHKLR